MHPLGIELSLSLLLALVQSHIQGLGDEDAAVHLRHSLGGLFWGAETDKAKALRGSPLIAHDLKERRREEGEGGGREAGRERGEGGGREKGEEGKESRRGGRCERGKKEERGGRKREGGGRGGRERGRGGREKGRGESKGGKEERGER